MSFFYFVDKSYTQTHYNSLANKNHGVTSLLLDLWLLFGEEVQFFGAFFQ